MEINNYINGEFVSSLDNTTFDNINPHNGDVIARVARSRAPDVQSAISAAKSAQKDWAKSTVVSRGDLMRNIAVRMSERKTEIADVVAREAGKIHSHAMGETQAAIEMGFFIAGEGRRYYGRTTTASMEHRQVMTVRQPLGIAALIIANNTPIANVAWKAFPSMVCGNASIMKPSEDTSATAWIFADICREVGVPAGVFNVVNGFGKEAGAPLVESPDVDLVSFTGGCEAGRHIQKTAGARLAKVCMELGGKNALVVCDDADLDLAVHWTLASAFSNAGQRCAAGSRVVVFKNIYDAFRDKLLSATKKITLGIEEGCYSGPVINERALEVMVNAVEQAVNAGATLVCGGKRSMEPGLVNGYYMEPTILENVNADDPIAQDELFGPVTALIRVNDLDEAIDVANNSSFGLTSTIHTASLHRSMTFAERVEAGVIVVNGGTHGSEPHMGFGGVKNSGTGWREAGVEALDVYSDWKYINLITDPDKA